MPTGPSDKSQQPMGSGFAASNLYPAKNIWNAAYSNARDRSIAAKGSPTISPDRQSLSYSLVDADADEPTQSGSSALNANSEADVWTSNPWKAAENPSRSVSTSPNRTRDVFDHAHSAIGTKKAGFPPSGFQDESESYGFSTQKRGSQEASYIESMASFAARENGLPPSRHSQGSPAFPDLYQTHKPTNSQSRAPGHNTSLSTQAANQRAFNLNKQIDDDLSMQFARRANLEQSAFNPASQPFQLNPGSQAWMAEGNSRMVSPLEYGSDAIGSHMSSMKRPSIDRVSPSPTYRLESGSPRGFGPSADVWGGRPSSRDPRTGDADRRSQQYTPSYSHSFYANQYPYGNIAPQYAPNYIDPYAQNFRHPLLQNYGLPPLHTNYGASNAAPATRTPREQDPSKSVRSFLLEEFRQSNKSSKRYELKDIYNHVVEFSGDQHGSRFIQQKLETANSDEKEQVFREIEPNAIQLMKDVFGNYVVQKFFEHGNQVQKKVLAEKMKGKVIDLSVQVYACRVVQKALEHVLVEQQAELTKELESDILRVIRDQNGNHVVQKIIELVPRQYIDFIMDALRGQVTGLASHTYGCRVIQRMLEYGTEADKLEIMTELHSSAQILITDQYGNYVAQHVIQNGKPEDRDRLIQLVMAQLLTLSKHKFASNVVEKCIEHGTPAQRSAIRVQLTTVGSDGTSPLQQMMRDQYGNYVIQKLLGQLDGVDKEALVEEIKPQFFALKRNGASRQLQALEKLLGLGGNTNGNDASSIAPTPSLTNETNSPLSNSPPSTHASAVDAPEATGKAAANVNGVKVHDEVA